MALLKNAPLGGPCKWAVPATLENMRHALELLELDEVWSMSLEECQLGWLRPLPDPSTLQPVGAAELL
eukprot:1437419-Amphidinium_carterae.1